MFDTIEKIEKVQVLIKQAAIELVHPEAWAANIEITQYQIKVKQTFPCIFDCWWTSYEVYVDNDGFITHSYFGDHDYPVQKELPRNIGFEKAVLKILKENL